MSESNIKLSRYLILSFYYAYLFAAFTGFYNKFLTYFFLLMVMGHIWQSLWVCYDNIEKGKEDSVGMNAGPTTSRLGSWLYTGRLSYKGTSSPASY